MKSARSRVTSPIHANWTHTEINWNSYKNSMKACDDDDDDPHTKRSTHTHTLTLTHTIVALFKVQMKKACLLFIYLPGKILQFEFEF